MNAHVQTFDAGSDAILARLDREHRAAYREACRLAAADVEANGGDVTTLPDDWEPADYVQTAAGDAAEKASHAAWLAFESLGDASACFPADSREAFECKARILRRAAQGLPAAELLAEPRLRRIWDSLLHDALELFGAPTEITLDADARAD
jgi:hypothetical protein